jgi:glycosyltransferase involved in cell wall biosynthesis
MKILIIHNAYQSASPSGEDIVAREEAALLREHGHEVIEHWRHNDELEGLGRAALALKAGAGSVFSASSLLEMRTLLRRERPDVAHFHNIFPLISPSAYLACKLEGVPVVQTLHNYRLVCANGMLFRDGKVCELCPEKGSYWGLVHGCYRDSRLMTSAHVIGQYLHGFLKTHARLVDRFIALTDFAREKMIRWGLPAEKVVVKPNFAPRIKTDPDAPRKGFLFVGRLDEAKGVRVLVEAARLAPDLEFSMIGDGPLSDEVSRGCPPNLAMKGRLPFEETHRAIAGARAVVLPSLCYEGFPRVIAEAMSAGTPVIASNHGAMAAIVKNDENGLLFEPGNPQELASACGRMSIDSELASRLSAGANATYELICAPEANNEKLVSIYRGVIEG